MCTFFIVIIVLLLLSIVCHKIFFTYFPKWCIVYFMLYPVLMLHICAGYFLIHEVTKKKWNQELDFWHSQNCFGFMFYFRVYNHNFHSIFLDYSPLLCCIDLENRFWHTWLSPKLFCGHQWKSWYKAFLQIGGMVGIG